MDSDNDSYHFLFLNVKRTRTPGLKTAAVKIQHKNCLQSILRKKIINKLFAGLGRSALRKTVPSVLSTALGLRPYFRPLAKFFPIRTSRPANNIYIIAHALRTGESSTVIYVRSKENVSAFRYFNYDDKRSTKGTTDMQFFFLSLPQ